jgi:hypothetical protein
MGDELQKLSENYLAVKAQIGALEQRAGTIKEEIDEKVAARLAEGTTTTKWEFDHSYVLWVNPTSRESLDRAKLVQAGVTAEQINKGTIKKPVKGYVKVEGKK